MNPAPQVDLPDDQLICVGENSTLVTFATDNSGGTTTYAWTNDNTAIGLGAGATSATIPAFTTTNTGTTPISGDIVITPTFTNGTVSCTGNPQTFTITVNPEANVLVTVPTAIPYTILNGADTNIELDSDVAGTTFTWIIINENSTGALPGGPIAMNEKIIQPLVNATAAPVTVTYRINPLANGCAGPFEDFDVTVDPSVDITVDNVKPDICTGGSTQIDISSSVAGATFIWSVVDLNALGASTQALPGIGPNTGFSIQDVLVNSSTVTDSVIYTFKAIGPAPSFVESIEEVVKVYVYPTPLATPTNVKDSICNGTATDILMDSDVTGTTFSWTVLDPSALSGATNSVLPFAIGDHITQTLDNTGNVPITVTYQIVPTGPAAGSCSGVIFPVKVVVDPTPTPIITNTNDEFCNGDFTAITLNSSVANSEYVYSIADPKGTGAFGGTGFNLDIIAQQLLNATQSPVNIIYEIDVNGPGTTACPGATTYENVQINPLPNTTAITGLDTVCELTPNIVFQTELEADSYFDWELPATLGTRNFGGDGTGSNAIVFTAQSTPVIYTDSVSVFETNVYGCTNEILYKPLTIIPFPVESAISGETDPCANSTHKYSVPLNPTSTYQWYAPVGAGFATDPTLDTVNITFGLISGQIRVVETTAGGCITNHTVFNVTVHQLPISTLNADKPTICDGETVLFTAGPTVDMVNFEFLLNSGQVQDGVLNTWSSATLATDDEISVIVTSDFGCTKESMPVTMTVNPDPIVTLVSDAVLSTICDGDAVTFDATSADAVLYNFYLNANVLPEQSGPLYFWTAGPGTISNGDVVHVEVQNASGCWGTSGNVTTFVNALPTGFLDGDYSFCPGESRDMTVDMTGATPYKVTIDNGVGQQVGYTTGANIPVSPVTSTTYSLTEIIDANGCISPLGANLTGDAIMTVYEGAQIFVHPRPAEVCELIDTSFSVSAVGDNLRYEWYEALDYAGAYVLVGGDSPTLDILAPTAALDSNYYMVMVIAQCDTIYSDTVMLDVKIDAIASRDPIDVIICEGLPTGFGVDAGTSSTPSFQWYVDPNTGSFAPLSDVGVYTGSKTDSLKISSAVSTMNNYRYYVDITSDCGGVVDSNPALLTVNDRPEVIEQPVDTVVCENQQIFFTVDAGETSNPDYLWQVDMRAGAGFEDITGDSAGIYTDHDLATLLVDVTSRFDQYRYRAIVSSAECTPAATSSYATVTVHEIPEVLANPAASIICEDQSTVFSVNAGETTSPVYTWEVDMNTGTFVEIGGDTAVYAGHNTSTLILSTVPSTYNNYLYRVNVAGACPVDITAPVAGVLLTVNDQPEIATEPENDTVCELDPAQFSVVIGPTTVPTYQWQVNKIGLWVNLTAADETSGDYTGVFGAILDVNTPDLSYNNYRYKVIVSGTCSPSVTSAEATLVIDTWPEISLDPVGLTICDTEDAQFTVEAGNTTEPVYLWEYSPDGIVAYADAALLPEVAFSDLPTLDVVGVPAAYKDYRFRATVSGKCNTPVQSAVAILGLYDNPQIASQPQDTTTCEGIATAFGVDAGITEAPSYLWEVDNGVDGWLPVSGGQYSGVNNDSLKIIGPTSEMDGYEYHVIVSGLCSPPITSDDVTLTITENPEIFIQPVSVDICEELNTSFTVDPGVTTTPTYQWYVDDGLGGGMQLMAGETNPTLDIIPATFAMDEYKYEVIVGGDCGAPVTSTEVELIVYREPEISLQPLDTTTCESANVSFTIELGETDSPDIQWFEDDGVSGPLPISNGGIYSGATGTLLQIFSVDSAMSGYDYYAEITNLCAGPLATDIKTLTVLNPAVIWQQPTDSTICEGSDADFTVVATGTNLTYLWQVDMRGGAGYEDITGDSAGIYTFHDEATLNVIGTSRFDNYRYRVIVTSLDCSPARTSDYATLSINEEAEIITPPSASIICEDQSTVFSVDAGVTTGVTYIWEVDKGGGAGMENVIADSVHSGVTTSNLFLSSVPSTYNGWLYQVTVGGICPDIDLSPAVLLTVNEVPQIDLDPVNDTVCENTDAQFTVTLGPTTGATYQWQVNRFGAWENIPGAMETFEYDGINLAVLDVNSPDLSYNNYRYRVIVGGTCTPSVTSEEATLIIDTRPEISVQPINMTICEDGDVQLMVFAGGTTEPVYLWQYSDNAVDPWTDAALLPEVARSDSNRLDILGIPSAFHERYFRATVSGKCTAPVFSDLAQLTVNEKPEIDIQPADTTACEQDTVIFTVDPGLTTIPAYVWQYYTGATWLTIPPTIYEGVNNDTLQVNGINSSLNGQRYRVVVSGTCGPDSISEEAVLTVTERPEVVGVPMDQTICENDNTSFGISTGVTTSPIITWEYENGGGWTTADGGAGIFANWLTDTLEVNGADATWDGAQFRVFIENGCGPNDTSFVATLTVKNRPLIVGEPTDTTTCEGIPTLLGIDAGNTSDPIYIWEVSSDGTNWNSVSGAQYGGIGTDTLLINSPNSSMNGLLYRAVLGGYCTPNDTSVVVTLTVTENAEIVLQPGHADICEFGDTIFYASPGITTNPQFQWSVDDNLGGGMTPLSDGAIYTGTEDSILVITGATYAMDNYKYQVEVWGDCGGIAPSNVVQLTVAKLPYIVSAPTDTTTCELNNVSFTVDVGETDSPVFQWYEDDLLGGGPQPITNGGSFIGTNAATLQIFGVDSAMTGYEYTVSITNSCHEPLAPLTAIATLYVQSAPHIWVQPSDSTICEGLDATFTVAATGETLTYEWYVVNTSGTTLITNTGIYSGQGSPTLQLIGADRNNDLDRYYVRIIGTCLPPTQSNIAFLYVNNPPEIATAPENDTICEYSTASFNVIATGDGLGYQWSESPDGTTWTPLVDDGLYIGTTLATLNIFNRDRTYNNYQYRVLVTGTCADAQPAAVLLTVKNPPLITTQPIDTTVCHGNPATFIVVADGTELEYQWQVKTVGAPSYVDIPDGSPDYLNPLTATLTKITTDATTENGNSYKVRVYGPCGSQLSSPVLMSVNSLPSIAAAGQPTDDFACEGDGAQFEAFASGPDLTYQWWFTEDGTNWNTVPDDLTYDGVTSEKLIVNTTDFLSMNGNQYALFVGSSCAPISTDTVTLTVWQNPTANITGAVLGTAKGSPIVICGGDLLELDGNPDGGSMSWSNHKWTGDALLINPTNSQTPTFQTFSRGLFNVVYTVTDDNGCIGQDVELIENYRPIADFSAPDMGPACGDLEVDFVNESSPDAKTFNWDFGNGSTSNVENPTSYFDNFEITGEVLYYQVVLTVTDSVGCQDDVLKPVIIYPKVNPTITAIPETGCQPLNVNLTAQSGAAAYHWDFGDGVDIPGSYFIDHLYINATTSVQTYQTILTTTSAYGCTSADTVDIVVDPVPSPKFTADPATQTQPVSGPSSVTFSNITDAGPWTFEWDYGDGTALFTTTSQADIVHAYDQPGIYMVTLYTNLGACRDSAKTVVTISPREPEALFHSITEGCHPLEVQFFNTSQFATNYTWQFGDGSISTQENPLHTFYEPTEYTVRLLASGPGGSDQTESIITVHATPQVFFNYAPDSVFVNDKPVRFANLTAYATDYLWNFGDYDEYSTAEDSENTSVLGDPTHVYMFEGWKDVLLIARNGDLCEDSLFIPLAIKVIPAGALRFPNIFRPGDSPTGGTTDNLNDPSAKNSVFFPGVNKQVSEYHLYIYNRWGQLLFQSDKINVGWDGFINDTKASQGVYIWKVTGIYSNGSPFSDAGDVTLVWQ